MGGGDVGHDVIEVFVALGLVFAADDDVLVGIAEFDPPFEAVEEGRRDGQISLPRVAVGDVADMGVDAENFLNDDDGAFRITLGLGPVGGKFVAVGSR